MPVGRVRRRSVLGEKMRVHILAKELRVPSKTIIEKCRAEGVDSVKNHMSTLSAGLHATICEWFSESGEGSALETSRKVDLKKVRIAKKQKKNAAARKETQTVEATQATNEPQTIEADEPVSVAASVGTLVDAATGVSEAASAFAEQQPAASVSGEDHSSTLESTPGDSAAATAVSEAPAQAAPEEIVPAEPGGEPQETSPDAATNIEEPPTTAIEKELPGDQIDETPPAPPEPIQPAGPHHVPTPAKLRGPRVVRYEAPDYDARPPKRTPDREGPSSGAPPLKEKPSGPDAPKSVPVRTVRRRGRVNQRRAADKMVDAGERLAEWRDQDLAERKQRLAGATGRRIIRRRVAQATHGSGHPAFAGPKTEATVHEPVRMKEFCSETGLNFVQLFKILRDEHDLIANINMVLPSETAQLLALTFGIELVVVPAKTLLDELSEEVAHRPRKNLTPRPPVVAMLGHVDHGKTSLLDAIRRTHVAAGEDGGITQHISSYHIETSLGPVTFLDTPGHAAFTAMRARGANITDVVVLVIAADDGVMPQTVEAINHAKAAEVPVVVALNKIDLGDQNMVQICSDLTNHGLTPSGDWGGDVDIIATSATTGKGISELSEHLADLSSLLELKADATLPAAGTVIEAQTKPGVGAVVQVLIQEGTLNVGDFVVCGSASGKVRALHNDRGAPIKAAYPSFPVEVWGLDDVPAAGDKLYQVDNLTRAKQIAEEIKRTRLQNARLRSRKAKSLQEMLQRRDSDEVPELNVIIKADVDGSVTALNQALAQIPSDEVKLAIRHAGVGTVNDSDVNLAATCGGLILAFRVDVALGARRLSEQHGVDIRTYRVIYHACDDIKSALEGLLAPEETIETRSTSEVREVFHLSRKAGVIAGSHVTSGTLNRAHLVKLIRDGVIIREHTKIASLRRFKEDAKEVRSGFECGIRLAGFDDLHVGDVIESYEIIQTPRKL